MRIALRLFAGLWFWSTVNFLVAQNRNPNANLSPNLDNRPKVSVYYFSYTQGRSSYRDAQMLSQQVEADFVQTKRFLMVERQKLGQLSEIQLQNEVLVDNVVSTGKMVGVEYVILGHIDNFNLIPRTSYGGGMVTTFYTASLSMTLKLVDVYTGVILATESITFNPMWGQPTEDQARAAALRNIDEKVNLMIRNNFPLVFRVHSLDAIHKKRGVRFLSMLGGLEDGVKVGDVYSIVFEEDVEGGSVRRRQIGRGMVARVEGPNSSLIKVMQDGALGQRNIIESFFKRDPKRVKAQQMIQSPEQPLY